MATVGLTGGDGGGAASRLSNSLSLSWAGVTAMIEGWTALTEPVAPGEPSFWGGVGRDGRARNE